MARWGRWARAARRLAAVLALAAPGAAAAVEVRYEASLLSHYVWRGITLTDDPVFQPAVGIAHDSGVSFELWGNVDLGDDNDTGGEINETRLILDYRRELGALEIGAGLIEYLFPGTSFPGTREVFLRLRIDALVSPRLELFYDVDEIDGAYARLALVHERELRPHWTLALEGSAGYADDAFAIGEKAGLHDVNLELRIERSKGPLDLHFRGGWTGSLDSQVLLDQPTSFWTGFTVSVRHGDRRENPPTSEDP
jgi:hypothetical protein